MTTTQKVLIAATAASVAVAVGTGVYETRRISRTQEEIRTVKQQQEPFTEQVQQLRQERDQARRSLSVLRRENNQSRDQAAQLQAPSSPATASNPSDIRAGTMEDQQMKEAKRAQQKMELNKKYRALFKYLNLPADKLDALKDLIVDHETAEQGAGMALVSGSESERKQAVEEIKALDSDYHKKIQDLLGAQNYQVYQYYEETWGERQRVQMFEDTLPYDAAMTDQQEKDLITAMTDEWNALEESRRLNMQNQTVDQMIAARLTDEGIAEEAKKQDQWQQACVKRAAAILTPAQLEQFTQWEQQQSVKEAADFKAFVQALRNKGPTQPPAGSQTPAH